MTVNAQKTTKEEIVRNDDIVTIDAMLFLMQLKEALGRTLSQRWVLPLTSDRLNRLKEEGLVEVVDKGFDRFTITQKGCKYVERFALELIAEKLCAKTPAEVAKVAELLRKPD